MKPRRARVPAEYTISVEPTEGATYVLEGTIANLNDAKSMAGQVFRSQHPQPIRTVAVIQGTKIVDVFDGTWNSESAFFDEEPGLCETGS